RCHAIREFLRMPTFIRPAPAGLSSVAPSQPRLALSAGGILAALVALALPALSQAQTVATPPTTMQAITVTGSAPLNNATPPAFTGGLVARGGQAGVLGNMDYMDMPFRSEERRVGKECRSRRCQAPCAEGGR